MLFRSNAIHNVHFINGKVENKIQEVLEKDKPEIIVLDPPRIGCNKQVLETVLNSGVGKIIYVSCNPSTLARDLGILTNNENNAPFTIKSIQLIDMFPHSYHVECVVLLER